MENRKESSSSGFDITRAEATAALGNVSFSLDATIQMHLVDCVQCQRAIAAGPVGLGQKSGMCDVYWQLQLLQAEHEGYVNNVVAHDEFGREAPKRGRLE